MKIFKSILWLGTVVEMEQLLINKDRTGTCRSFNGSMASGGARYWHHQDDGLVGSTIANTLRIHELLRWGNALTWQWRLGRRENAKQTKLMHGTNVL